MAVENIPTMTSPRTRAAVRNALMRSKTPLSVREIQDITGKSYNTVKQALIDVGAMQNRDVYPARWSTVNPYEIVPQIGNVDTNVLVPLQEIEPREVIERFNRARPNFARALATMEIDETTSVHKLLDDVVAIASALASVAWQIEQSKNLIDWYAKLGGQTNEEA